MIERYFIYTEGMGITGVTNNDKQELPMKDFLIYGKYDEVKRYKEKGLTKRQEEIILDREKYRPVKIWAMQRITT